MMDQQVSTDKAGDSVLHQSIKVVPNPDNQEITDRVLEDLNRAAAEKSQPLADLMQQDRQTLDFLVGVFSNSTYLRDLGIREPVRLFEILTGDPGQRIDQLVAEADSIDTDNESEFMQKLRQIKKDVALTIALADIGGIWETMQVTKALSDLADASVRSSMRFCLRDMANRNKFNPVNPDDPLVDSGWFVLAMGKHGAFELNYSSDIDLIVLFDPDISPLTEDAEPQVEFVRQTKRLVKLMQDRTQDGYVFRTDLRLRPDPGATPPAISVPAALVYYESLGQNWERAALIKARPIGDVTAGKLFLKEITPFIWRKYLDYAAIAEVHKMKRQIQAHKGHGTIAVAGHNVKLGRGGIREIEFFVQTQQLIAGGRDPELRGRETLEMLNVLVDRGWVEKESAEKIRDAYCFLRNVEHRIQMLADEQTHSLPETDEGLVRISNLMGFEGIEEFSDALRSHLETVQQEYMDLFEDQEVAPETEVEEDIVDLVFTGDEDDPATLEALTNMGFKDPKRVSQIIRAWHFGRYAATRANQVRERLLAIQPALVGAFANTENPDGALIAFDDFLSRLPAGVQLFALLRSNPNLLHLLAKIMGDAPRMAQIISMRANILDAVLDPSFFGSGVVTKEELEQLLAMAVGDQQDLEDILESASIFGQEQMFLIGVRVLSDTMTPIESGIAYSRLAEVLSERFLKAVQHDMAEIHGELPGVEMAILAMGKFGGMEMTASSDLDLMLLYEFPESLKQSDGPKPLAPSQYFIRLTQRFVSTLSVPTAQGKLYEVDFRLRPSGEANSIATQLSSFITYQKEQARVWEKMALTRARIVTSSSEAFAAKVDQAVREAIEQNMDPDYLKDEINSMRKVLDREKKTKDMWDLKHIPGGLVDIEFIAQYLNLLHGNSHPDVRSTNTLTVLENAEKQGVATEDVVKIVIPALMLFQRLTQLLRLVISENFRKDEVPSGVLALLAKAGEVQDFKQLETKISGIQENVRKAFIGLLGSMEEE